MTLICCVDDNMGMTFNNRRQSRDIEVTKAVIDLAKKDGLFINQYSEKLFIDAGFSDFTVADGISPKTNDNYCYFNETVSPSAFEKYTDRIILFRWNRTYPSDIHFDIDLNNGWRLISSKEFAGKSHEKITMEVYEK